MTENEAIEIIEDVTWKDFGRHPDFPEAREKAIKALEEVQQYRAIGTPEECRMAVEKQKAKKIEIFNGQASCPNCKHLFGRMDVVKKLITWDMPHCKNCGQRIDWSDEE